MGSRRPRPAYFRTFRSRSRQPISAKPSWSTSRATIDASAGTAIAGIAQLTLPLAIAIAETTADSGTSTAK
jgi:hypothetical protein